MSHSSPMGGYSSWASSLALLVLIKTESQTSHSTRNIGWYSDICPSKCSRGSAVLDTTRPPRQVITEEDPKEGERWAVGCRRAPESGLCFKATSLSEEGGCVQ